MSKINVVVVKVLRYKSKILTLPSLDNQIDMTRVKVFPHPEMCPEGKDIDVGGRAKTEDGKIIPMDV